MARWQLAWLLARRFRRGRERSRFLSFISASSTFGIALGCMVFITGLSVMNGFGQVLEERFLKLIPHVEFRAVEGALQHPQTIFQLAEQHPQVRSARAAIRTQALVQQGREFVGVEVVGVDPAADHAISAYVTPQVWQQLQQPNTLILGQGLAQRLGVNAGENLRLVVAAERGFQAPQRISLEVVGQFDFGGQVDHQRAYVSLDTARKLTGLAQGITAVELELTDLFAAEQVANDIGYQLRDYVYLDHWMRAQGHLYRDIQMVRMVMYLVLILVLAVACFNIVSTLIMTVQEKRRHIGILRTMGLRASGLVRVFVMQGIQNGLVGVTFGVLAGIALSWSLPGLLAMLEQLTGSSLLASDVYFIDHIPVLMQARDIIIVAVVALLLSLLATLYPAWQASRIQVVAAISS
ncbi:lipoprotein-releasing ABC transporter permease subunit [Pseudidiomarina insulisalsae]|uniref:Lipoprotein-releasing system transmembrane subunit, LolC/LolE family n=1 Tax=Pseudidiomarina insulisalsae TaxID=575789 RepID=A0A432YMW0_9GAMM|nr:lipoprotein-releasing ABC transporter permease subunit [Pseudidiomarina insulisalsae]RUO62273.1 lipoprotein-releasing system transmembrane subunit, LolC/LolE family [Pseudidiomarina insulisalsae]